MIPFESEIVSNIKVLREWYKTNEKTPENQAKLTEALALLNDWRIEVAYSRASPKQTAFADVFFDRSNGTHKKSIFAAIGANRSGKTIVGGWLCFAIFLREKAQAGDVFWCVSQNLDRSITGQQRELWEALPRQMFIDHKGNMQGWSEKIGFGGHRKIVLNCKGGGTCLVEFRSADQDSNTFEQAKLRGAWVDEACPEEIFNRLLARIIDLDGWIIFTDIRHQWWQEQRLIGAAPESDIHAVQFCMRDNAHTLPPGAIEQSRARMTEDEARMRIDGESGLMEGLVFKRFKDSQIISPFAIPPEWPKWRAIDYGSSAPTACLWLTMAPNECVYVYREFYEVSPSCEYSAKMIISLSVADYTESPDPYECTYIDPHAKDKPPAIYGNAPTVGEQFATAGIATRGWPYIQIMGEHACVEKIKFRDEHGTIKVFDTCVAHIRERKNWKHKCDKDGHPVASDAYENEHSHSNDCLKGFLATNPTFSRPRLKEEPPDSSPPKIRSESF